MLRWFEAQQRAHRRLLQSTGTVAGRNGFNVVALNGIINEPQRATIMALDGAPSASSGRHYGDHAGHHGQPKCLSAVSWLESRVGFPYLPFGGDHFCLASGAVLDPSLGRFRGKGGDEQTLLRTMLDTLNRGDVVLRDAYYATYFLLCELQRRGIDGVFEQYGARRRSTDFQLGQSLGSEDHLVALKKPRQRPTWMSQTYYDDVPETLTVRELKTGGKILITTLKCPQQASKAALKSLYKDRWHV